MKKALLFIVSFIFVANYSNVNAQCANASNIYSFIYNGNSYEIIKENRSWVDAAACAVERGGWLAEINDVAEQDAIYNELSTNAGINLNSTVAPDGGGGSYVWIGGNDMLTEGAWVWDGNNDNTSTQFWQGTSSGSSVGGLYNNWGNEPDDYSGQDALGLSLNGWPLGVAGQWNDVKHTNTLYYVVEYSGNVGFKDIDNKVNINIYPNPSQKSISIDNDSKVSITEIVIFDLMGRKIKDISPSNTNPQLVDISDLNKGVYVLRLFDNEKQLATKKIILE